MNNKRLITSVEFKSWSIITKVKLHKLHGLTTRPDFQVIADTCTCIAIVKYMGIWAGPFVLSSGLQNDNLRNFDNLWCIFWERDRFSMFDTNFVVDECVARLKLSLKAA